MRRKIFLFAALFCFGIALNAQNTFNKGTLAFNASIGIGNYKGYSISVPPLAISGEYGILDNLFDDKSSIGVGGYIGYASYKETWSYPTYKHNIRTNGLCISTRGVFHYQLVDKLDTYGGLMIGFENYSYKEEYEHYPNHLGNKYVNKDGNDTYFSVALFVGARYYFTDNFAVMSELGYGFTFFSVGASFKL